MTDPRLAQDVEWAKRAFAQGATTEQVVEGLKDRGLFIVQAMHVLVKAVGLSLRDAKTAVAEHPAWARVARRMDVEHARWIAWARWPEVGGLPRGWEAAGALPPDQLDPVADRDALTEDMLQVRAPGWTVDVGWYPECDPAGSFACLLVQDSQWDPPTERFETRDPVAVREWVARTLTRIATDD